MNELKDYSDFDNLFTSSGLLRFLRALARDAADRGFYNPRLRLEIFGDGSNTLQICDGDHEGEDMGTFSIGTLVHLLTTIKNQRDPENNEYTKLVLK